MNERINERTDEWNDWISWLKEVWGYHSINPPTDGICLDFHDCDDDDCGVDDDDEGDYDSDDFN